MLRLHQKLAQGKWHTLTLMEQLGNIGSEVERAFKGKEKGDARAFTGAADRALELFDLTITDPRLKGRLREIVRLREVVCDFLFGQNQYRSSPAQLRQDFLYYGIAARQRS